MLGMWVVLLCGSHPVGAVTAARQLAEYRKQTWQIDSGLPQNTVRAILQARDGFIWMATEGGLVRFDGVDFRTFNTANTPSFTSNIVDGLAEASDGSLWIGTFDGIVRYQSGRFKAYTVADGLPSNAVVSVYRQRGGRIVVATSAGLAVVNGERFEAVRGTAAVSSAGLATVMTEDAEGTLWVAAGEQVLRVRAGSLEAEAALRVKVGAVHAMASDSQGDMWIGGTGGLQCFGPGKLCSGPEPALLAGSRSVTALIADPGSKGGMWIGTPTGLFVGGSGGLEKSGVVEVSDGLAGVEVQRLFADRSGALWVMYNRGLARILNIAGGGHRVEIASPQTSVEDVLAVMEDSEGDLWFGSESSGASVLRAQVFSSIAVNRGASGEYVRTVFQDHAGRIWIGTNGGGLSSFADGKIVPFEALADMGGDVVLSLAETGEDLWIGTPDGLIRRRQEQTQRFTTTDGLPDSFVRSLYGDRDGSLWIGTRHGLSHMKNGTFESYSTMDGLGSDVVGSVLRTHDGVLWVATLGGLSRWDGKRFTNLTKRDGMSADAVTALFEDGEGSLWIGTSGSGLNRLRNGRMVPFPAGKTGMPDSVYGILEDRRGALWMSAPMGIYRASIAALNAYADNGVGPITVAVFGVADGMQISEGSGGGHPAAWRMQDGTLWFATPKGVAWVNPELRTGVVQAPPVVIEQVSIDDKAVHADGAATMVVPVGHERITIRYAGLSFLSPQKVRYRYKLEGFDAGWVEAGAERTAYYTNVPPGQYKFSVMASSAESGWSEPASIDLDVRPRFYQTGWFYVLVSLVLFGVGYAAYRARVRYVRATYRAVMAERARIAREVHDTLAQGYVGVSVQLEITSRLLKNPKDSMKSYEAALDQLTATKELVRSSLAEARSSIWDLRSEGGDVDMLPSRMAKAVRGKTPAQGPGITFQVRGTYRPMPRKVEDQIVRIAQEALSNAVRHASARSIGVTLTYDASNLVLCVCDDGRGFDPSGQGFTAGGHFGLQGMRERAATIGARLDVDGNPGGGTEVRVTMDLNEAGKVDG